MLLGRFFLPCNCPCAPVRVCVLCLSFANKLLCVLDLLGPVLLGILEAVKEAPVLLCVLGLLGPVLLCILEAVEVQACVLWSCEKGKEGETERKRQREGGEEGIDFAQMNFLRRREKERKREGGHTQRGSWGEEEIDFA